MFHFHFAGPIFKISKNGVFLYEKKDPKLRLRNGFFVFEKLAAEESEKVENYRFLNNFSMKMFFFSNVDFHAFDIRSLKSIKKQLDSKFLRNQ